MLLAYFTDEAHKFMTSKLKLAITRKLTFEDLLKVRTPLASDRATLSPDGRYLAATLELDAEVHDEPRSRRNNAVSGSQIWLIDLEDGASSPISEAGTSGWRPRWSLNGSRLAFYTGTEDGARLCGWERKTGETRVLSEHCVDNLVGLDEPMWLDDSRIMIRIKRGRGSEVAKSRSEGSVSPVGPTVNVLSVSPRNGPGVQGMAVLQKDKYPDLGVVNFDTGDTQMILRDFPFQAAWASKDGTWVALLSLPKAEYLNQYRFVSDLFMMSASGGAPKLVVEDLAADGASGGYAGRLLWSPDSRHLAFLHNGKILLLDPTKDGARTLVPGHSFGTTSLMWHPSHPYLFAYGGVAIGDSPRETQLIRIAVSEDEGTAPVRLQLPKVGLRFLRSSRSGALAIAEDRRCLAASVNPGTKDAEVWRIDLDGGEPLQLLSEKGRLHVGGGLSDVSDDGATIVIAKESSLHPPEFCTADHEFQDIREVTNLNPHLSDVKLVETRTITWRTNEGTEIGGALMLPPDISSPPLVVMVYPGASMSGSAYNWNESLGMISSQLLAANGYGVFFPDLPMGDGRDPGRAMCGALLPGINEVVRLGLADGTRVGLMGQSAGGYAVNLLVAETSRFKAAISVNGVSNLSSFFGHLITQSDGSPFTYGAFFSRGRTGGTPSEKPLQYLAQSPVFSLDKVTTPLLLVSGLGDELAAGQMAEMYVGLASLEKEVTLLRYEDEGHVPTEWSIHNRRDVTERIIAWFDRWLCAEDESDSVLGA